MPDVKAKLILGWWLGALLGGCGGDARPSKAAETAAGDALPACESPEQAGCAACCVEQHGPGPSDLICYRRMAADGPAQRERVHDYAPQAAFLKEGPCPTSCRPCAACTRDRRKSYQQLLSKGCDCLDPFVREVVRSIDPCFSDGCGCTCSHLAALSECGPPI